VSKSVREREIGRGKVFLLSNLRLAVRRGFDPVDDLPQQQPAVLLTDQPRVVPGWWDYGQGAVNSAFDFRCVRVAKRVETGTSEAFTEKKAY
jgi:hypothetical protein